MGVAKGVIFRLAGAAELADWRSPLDPIDQTGTLHLFFLFIPIWLLTMTLYTGFAALAGARTAYPEPAAAPTGRSRARCQRHQANAARRNDFCRQLDLALLGRRSGGPDLAINLPGLASLGLLEGLARLRVTNHRLQDRPALGQRRSSRQRRPLGRPQRTKPRRILNHSAPAGPLHFTLY